MRTGNQPEERQKWASNLSKPDPQKKKMSSVRPELKTSKPSKGKEFTVKKYKPHAAPEIRHTLASKLRLVKSNPLLEVSGAITLPPNVKKPLVVNLLKENVQPQQLRTKDVAKPFYTGQAKHDKNNKNMAHKVAQQKREPDRIKPSNTLRPKQDNVQNKQPSVVQQRFNGKNKPLITVPQRKEIFKKQTQSATQTFSTAQQSKRPVILKTSLATKNKAQVIDKKLPQRKVIFSKLPNKSTVNMRRSRSASDLPSPIREDEDIGHKVFVKTPIPVNNCPSAQRVQRSNSWRQSMSNRNSCRLQLPPRRQLAPRNPHDLVESLENWLQKHSIPAKYFSDLLSFGRQLCEEATKAEESTILNTTFTADDSDISKAVAGRGEDEESVKEVKPTNEEAKPTNENSKPTNEDAKPVIEDTLLYILKLINWGYSLDTCESWLHSIQEKYHIVTEQPTYWECRAAIEEHRCDMKAAIDCYEQAIIKGAMPEGISISLDEMMEKFNFLNLDPEENKLNSGAKHSCRKVVDARNVFKSSLISFALRERKNKRSAAPGEVKATTSQYVATPVRRTGRISSSSYRSTPGLRCVSSLSQLEDDIRKSVVFEPNRALEP